jgi:hypothetical protein
VREIKQTHLQLDYMNKNAKKQALISIATQWFIWQVHLEWTSTEL